MQFFNLINGRPVLAQGWFLDGSAAAPSISFAAEPNTGFYRFGSQIIGIAIAGGLYGKIGSFASGISLQGAGGAYFYADGNGALGLVAAGTNQNVELKPSGDGYAQVTCSTPNAGAMIVQNTNTAGYCNLTFRQNTPASGYFSITMQAVSWSNQQDIISTGQLTIQVPATRSLLLYSNGAVTATLDASQNTTFVGKVVSSNATAGIGYSTGAGGTVTQATSKATGVTLNKVCGTITMNGASLAAATSVAFVLTNSAIAAGDVVALVHDSVGTLGAYSFAVTPAAGSATITVRNNSAGALLEAIVLRFAVIKAVTA